MKKTSFRKILSTLNAVDLIWKDIIKPEKPKQIGDALRFAAYINYCRLIEILSKNKDKKFEINFNSATTVNIPERDLNNFQPLLKIVFKKIDSIENRKRVNLFNTLLWGAKLLRIEGAVEFALKRNSSIYFVEDGFYRSVTSGLKKVDKCFSTSHSFIFDDMAPHYDGNHVSRLETLLTDNDTSYKKHNDELNQLKEYIIRSGISKYNDQPDFISPAIGKKEKKVLIIMQSFNDASVTIVGGTELSFKQMIEDAINENPDSDILIKVHPDTIIKKNKSYAEDFLNDKRVYVINTEISLISLIKYSDKIYVFSSQAGFEALLFGKKVITYGKPFYSGFGLTMLKERVALLNGNIKYIYDNGSDFFIEIPVW